MANKLQPRHLRAIEALAGGATQAEAASAAGVSPRTIRNWLADPAFADAVRRTEAARLERITRRLVALADASLERMGAVIRDDATPTPSYLRAAKILIDAALRYKELSDFEARLSALEERMSNENV